MKVLASAARLKLFLTVCLLGSLLASCSGGEKPEKVSLSNSLPSQNSTYANGEELRVAIAAIISPKETFIFYKDFMNFISEKAGRNIKLVQRETYKEINDLLETGELDLAFVCTGAYVEGHDKFGMELLAAPVTNGQPVYYSYIIVPSESPAKKLEDLRGKTFAFTDPMSNTGRLSPVYTLGMMKQSPETFFKKTVYTYSHDRSIESVAKKLVDGAAVDSLIWDYMMKTNTGQAAKTKIIAKSAPYGIPPVVASKTLDPAMKEKLLNLFLTAHEDPRGKDILAKMMIEKFIPVEDPIYDSVRAMDKWAKANNVK